MGLPFNEPESEHEWEAQVNWDELRTSSSVKLSTETSLGAGVYRSGVNSVLYISPLLNQNSFEIPSISPPKIASARRRCAAPKPTWDMPPPVPGRQGRNTCGQG